MQAPKRDKNNKPLYTGRTAEIFEWQPGQFIKLFNKGYMLDDVEKEIKGTIAAEKAGLIVPKLDPKARLFNFRYGIVMNEVEGDTLKEKLLAKPWKLKQYFNLMVHEHVKINSIEAPVDMPCQTEAVLKVLSESQCFSQEEVNRLKELLIGLPQGSKLCHGDMHPENLIYHSDKLTTIDWCDARRGNPIGDLANTSMTISHFWRSDFPPNPLFGIFAGMSARVYLNLYAQLSQFPFDWKQFRYWCCIFSAYNAEKKSEGCRERAYLIKSVRRELKNYR